MFDSCKFIIASRHAIEAIDRMFRDICNVNTPFGGKVILLGGDFRQTLPVVRRARPAQIDSLTLFNYKKEKEHAEYGNQGARRLVAKLSLF